MISQELYSPVLRQSYVSQVLRKFTAGLLPALRKRRSTIPFVVPDGKNEGSCEPDRPKPIAPVSRQFNTSFLIFFGFQPEPITQVLRKRRGLQLELASSSSSPRTRSRLELGPASNSSPPRARARLELGLASSSNPPRARAHLELELASVSSSPQARARRIFLNIAYSSPGENPQYHHHRLRQYTSHLSPLPQKITYP